METYKYRNLLDKILNMTLFENNATNLRINVSDGLGCSRSRLESHFCFYVLRTYVGFYYSREIVVVCMENRDSVWEQVIRLERGYSIHTENKYSVR